MAGISTVAITRTGHNSIRNDPCTVLSVKRLMAANIIPVLITKRAGHLKLNRLILIVRFIENSGLSAVHTDLEVCLMSVQQVQAWAILMEGSKVCYSLTAYFSMAYSYLGCPGAKLSI